MRARGLLALVLGATCAPRPGVPVSPMNTLMLVVASLVSPVMLSF